MWVYITESQMTGQLVSYGILPNIPYKTNIFGSGSYHAVSNDYRDTKGNLCTVHLIVKVIRTRRGECIVKYDYLEHGNWNEIEIDKWETVK